MGLNCKFSLSKSIIQPEFKDKLNSINVYFRADELRQKFDLEMAAYKQTAHHY